MTQNSLPLPVKTPHSSQMASKFAGGNKIRQRQLLKMLPVSQQIVKYRPGQLHHSGRKDQKPEPQ
jgi:hypothetical protein